MHIDRLSDSATAEPGGQGTALRRYLAPLQPGRGVLLWGGQIRLLAAAAAAWGVAKAAPVLVVDAANRFDPYQLVREGKRYGLPPQHALAGVQVSRAFTSHQLVRLLQEVLPASLEPGSLVLLLGPVSLFYDEQVPLAERRRLFRELVRRLTAIKRQAALLLLQPLLPRTATNRHFGRLLTPMLDYLVTVGSGEREKGRAIHRVALAASALPRAVREGAQPRGPLPAA